jgi:hypothetical protein
MDGYPSCSTTFIVLARRALKPDNRIDLGAERRESKTQT